MYVPATPMVEYSTRIRAKSCRINLNLHVWPCGTSTQKVVKTIQFAEFGSHVSPLLEHNQRVYSLLVVGFAPLDDTIGNLVNIQEAR